MDDDDLEALRRADPIARTPLPSSIDPAARALFERITMTETPTDHRSTAPTTDPPARSRGHRAGMAAAVAAAAVALVAVGVIVTQSGDGGNDPVAQPPSTTAGAVTPGGSAGSCVERYDLTTLPNRELALDGTVERVDGDELTLTVNEWFRGGSSSTVTLAGAQALSGLTSAGSEVGVEPGSRLLVAGDGGFAWSCGFTQPYDPEVAEEWRAAVG